MLNKNESKPEPFLPDPEDKQKREKENKKRFAPAHQRLKDKNQNMPPSKMEPEETQKKMVY